MRKVKRAWLATKRQALFMIRSYLYPVSGGVSYFLILETFQRWQGSSLFIPLYG